MTLMVALLYAVIWVAIILVIAYLILWALGQLVPGLPPQIGTLIWVIAVLLCAIILIGTLFTGLPGAGFVPPYPLHR